MRGTTRRELVKRAVAAGAGLAALSWTRGLARAEPTKPLKILMLGGTAWLGPETVTAATKRGHTVTLFNRGKTNPGLFPELEKLHGDRNGDVSALKGRSFDAVIDTSAYVPAHVRRIAEVLGDRVGHYALVSTVSVYPKMGENRETITEETPVGTLKDETTEKVTGETYGPLKALCEREAEKAWPGKVANVRPGLIVGPGDGSDRFTYWPWRVAKGGEILAPGDGTVEAQCIDVRDLGDWLARLAEDKTVGVYNAVGFAEKTTWRTLLESAKAAQKSDATFTWVAEDFLEQQKVAAWMDLPLWLPTASNGHVANDRAIAKALKFRPIGATCADTAAWLVETKREVTWGQKKPGLAPEREAAVLAAWKASGRAK